MIPPHGARGADLRGAGDAGIIGHDMTPFPLDHSPRTTSGERLGANVGVRRDEAVPGGRIAAARPRRETACT